MNAASTSKAWGFGWTSRPSDEPSPDCTGLNAREVLNEYRRAWRVCNGTDWRPVFTFDGRLVLTELDELLEGLDDLAEGVRSSFDVKLGERVLS